MPNVVFTPLPDSSDERGVSFSLLSEVLDMMDKVRDVHIASVRPGAIRGNHYHSVKTEVITVAYFDAWSFYWDTGEGTEVRRRRFAGTGAVAAIVPLAWSHAVKNEGASDLWLFNASDVAFSREPGAVTDSHMREVVR
jgi:oxalate decarboxylase/phosphoglucose isomerase-like protein (cupin superfamily)